MMAYSRYFFCTFALLWLGLFTSEVIACSCNEPPVPCQAYWEASAVFIGTVIDSSIITLQIEDNRRERQRLVRFSLDEAFRGVQGATAEVITGMWGGDCGFEFKPGERYLIYAYRRQQDNKLHTSVCTRTRPVSKADEDLQYIRGLSSATAGSLVYGEVQRQTRDVDSRLVETPIPQMKITLVGDDKHLEVLTDSEGKFAFQNLSAGGYKVRIKLPAGLATYEPEQEIKVAERGCARVYFGVESDGRLRGKVFDANGQPMPKAQIALGSTNKNQYGHGDIVYSDQEGRYEFKRIPPGRYVLVIRNDGLTSQVRPFPALYYPGVADIAQATVIHVGEGEVIDNYDLRLPPPLTEHTIEGVVTWADGQPASNAYFGYMMIGDAVFYSVKLDQQGHFSFKVYNGVKVTLRASLELEKGKSVYSDWVEVPAVGDSKGIKIVLPGNR